MRASTNIKYLTFIAVLIMVLFFVEMILSLNGIEESIAFPIFWIVFFLWILFGKKFLQKRTK
ncbi:MAG: hypothetical protein CBE04_02990 [Acidimicrobiaceae bacterium TMED244]|nr:MAG: hypothetical protein CBE04_02990 [Acidimicrobiaceae bacterium TMED244]